MKTILKGKVEGKTARMTQVGRQHKEMDENPLGQVYCQGKGWSESGGPIQPIFPG